MRWDNLFDDLEGQLEHELGLEEVDERVEAERLRLGRLAIRDRLMALADATSAPEGGIRLLLTSGDRVTAQPTGFGRDWFTARIAGSRGQAVIVIAAVAGITLHRGEIDRSLDAARNPERSRTLSERLTLSFVLRDLCRRRTAVDLWLRTERLHGTIDRVGRDHLDLAVHELGMPRRESAVSEYRVVAFAEIGLIRA
jgi:hypothetical protein